MLIRQRECHSHYRDIHQPITSLYARPTAFLLATTPPDATKNEHVHFRRSRIEAESKSNRIVIAA